MTIRHREEASIRTLIENWARAVRMRDLEAILAHHSDDIVMYDVPRPFQSVGIAAYRETWDLFFAFTKPGVFDIQDLRVVAGEDVGFCFAAMRCADRSATPDYVPLDFRLTVGLRKVEGQWTVVHEHHSIPSE